MNNSPLVSIIIPVYNGQAYLSEAINSVLDQTYKSIQVIVIDDGSTDGSGDIAQSFMGSIEYYYQSNQGTAAARNFGVQMSKGALLAFLDQDDLWLENKLNLQVSAFKADTRTDIVFGQVKQFVSPEMDEQFRKNIFCPPHLMPGFLPSAMLIKRESFFRTGLFESVWQIGEWADWYARASEQELKKTMIPELVTLRRIHSGNKGITQRESLNEYIQILKASLDRRRS